MKEDKIIIVAGKRKTSVAKARLKQGHGNVTYNGKSHSQMSVFHKLALLEPIRIYEHVMGKMNFDIAITAKGGGKESQVQAARLAIAKVLFKATGSADLKKALMKYDRHLLVADTRRKEAYKPGDSKARASRQTSYR